MRTFTTAIKLSIAFLILSNCSRGGNSEYSDEANAIAYTRHCGGEEISSTQSIRFSRWEPPGGARRIFVQACINGGGCQPLLSYNNDLPPLIEVGSHGVHVTVAGRDIEVYADNLRVNGQNLPLEITQVDLSNREAMPEFRRALGLNFATFEWQCQGAEVWPATRQGY